MKIIKPYANLTLFDYNGNIIPFELTHGIGLLRKIETIGRVSHRSEDLQTPESYDKFLRAVVLGHGDWSIVEHASATVIFQVDRGITHEIVRHRLASYTQESTRFVNYTKKILPSFICPMQGLNTSNENSESNNIEIWNKCIENCEDTYRILTQNGIKPQIARSVLPNALASRLIVTMNLRTWRHFFVMRTSLEAHPQMREVTIPLLKQFQKNIPILFEDIIPEVKQKEGMKLVR